MGWKLSELFYLQSHGHSLGSYMGRIVYTRHLTCIPQLISHQYNQLQSKWWVGGKEGPSIVSNCLQLHSCLVKPSMFLTPLILQHTPWSSIRSQLRQLWCVHLWPLQCRATHLQYTQEKELDSTKRFPWKLRFHRECYSLQRGKWDETSTVSNYSSERMKDQSSELNDYGLKRCFFDNTPQNAKGTTINAVLYRRMGKGRKLLQCFN